MLSIELGITHREFLEGNMSIDTIKNFFKFDKKMMIKNAVLIAIGSTVTSVGINAFLVPHKFISGGVSGLAQFASYLTPLSVATYVLVFNIPIFIFGWRFVGRTFVIGSLFGTAMLTLGLYSTEWMSHMGWAPERLLSAIIGGSLSGGGTGLVFRANSSHGGTDIIGAAVKKHWSYSIGSVAFTFNVMIVLLVGLIFGLHAALYTIVAQFCAATALDKVMLGIDRSRAVFIITTEPKQVADLIMSKLARGVTYLEGEGAYLGTRRRVLYCVVGLRQLARVKYYVKSVDPAAFLTVAEVSEVMGKGFKLPPI